jgi:hypothetical protein
MTSAADRAEVLGAFDTALYPGGEPVTLETAWMGIYQTLWWFSEDYGVLHIREDNDFEKPLWRARARRVEQYIADAMGIEAEELPIHVDRMMLLPRWRGMQRNNPLGHGLRIILSELLLRYGNQNFTYIEEHLATNWFPGIKMPGRSKRPKIDVAGFHRSNLRPKAVMSCKWGFRHDRISDPTNECQEYKGAAINRQIMDLGMYVVTNEMSVSRLDKVLNQPCVDALVHVHLPAVEQAEPYSAEMKHAMTTGRLMDLVDFVKLTHTWQ